MIDVSLLVALCAIKFFLRSARILLRSQKNKKYTMRVSRGILKFAASKVSPKIMPIRMAKNISKISPAF